MEQLGIEASRFEKTARRLLIKFWTHEQEYAFSTILKIEQGQQNFEMTQDLSNKIDTFVFDVVAYNMTSHRELTEHLSSMDLDLVMLNDFRKNLSSITEQFLPTFYETIKAIDYISYHLDTIDMLSIVNILEYLKIGEQFAKYFNH